MASAPPHLEPSVDSFHAVQEAVNGSCRFLHARSVRWMRVARCAPLQRPRDDDGVMCASCVTWWCRVPSGQASAGRERGRYSGVRARYPVSGGSTKERACTRSLGVPLSSAVLGGYQVSLATKHRERWTPRAAPGDPPGALGSCARLGGKPRQRDLRQGVWTAS